MATKILAQVSVITTYKNVQTQWLYAKRRLPDLFALICFRNFFLKAVKINFVRMNMKNVKHKNSQVVYHFTKGDVSTASMWVDLAQVEN